jgi:hypothetical protein
MNGRVEDAITGRFLSADPYIADQTGSQSYNRYSYVMNNPMTLTDPTGFVAASPNVSFRFDTLQINEITITGSRIRDFITQITLTFIQQGSPPILAEINGGGTTEQSPDKPAAGAHTPRSCPKGTLADVARGLKNAGQKLADIGGAITLAGGTLIAGGAIASATGAGASVGAPAMAAGITAAGIGSQVTLAGVGMQAGGGLISAYVGNSQPLTSAALQAGAAGLNMVIDKYFHELTALFPIDPLAAAADRAAGENRCP